MNRADLVRRYSEAVYDTDRDAAFAAIRAAEATGMTPEEVVFELVIPATEGLMAGIGRDPDANLAQHFMTAQIAAEVAEAMLAKFSRPPEIVGRIVIGTAHGDLHSLGKRIVAGCLKALMVDVVDLGVNVPPERFVDAALQHGAQIIAVSSMMVHTALGERGSRAVRALLEARGLRDRMRLIVGGAPFRFDERLYESAGADGWAPDGVAAGQLIIRLIREMKP